MQSTPSGSSSTPPLLPSLPCELPSLESLPILATNFLAEPAPTNPVPDFSDEQLSQTLAINAPLHPFPPAIAPGTQESDGYSSRNSSQEEQRIAVGASGKPILSKVSHIYTCSCPVEDELRSTFVERFRHDQKLYGIQLDTLASLLTKVAEHVEDPPLKVLWEHYGSSAFLALHYNEQVTNILNNIGVTGRLTPQLLQVFRTLPVERLSLSSDTDHSDRVRGVANDSLLPTLSLPFSFTFLRDLDLSGSPLSSSSLLHLHDLPLETLNLANTGITLLGITHLIPLRVTLRELSVANNSKIDDSSIATIGLLTLLRCLDLRETAVSFLSLRLLAVRSPLAQPALVTIHPPSRVAASIAHSAKILASLPPPSSSATSLNVDQFRDEIRNLDSNAKVSTVRRPALIALWNSLVEKRSRAILCINLMGTQEDFAPFRTPH